MPGMAVNQATGAEHHRAYLGRTATNGSMDRRRGDCRRFDRPFAASAPGSSSAAVGDDDIRVFRGVLVAPEVRGDKRPPDPSRSGRCGCRSAGPDPHRDRYHLAGPSIRARRDQHHRRQ